MALSHKAKKRWALFTLLVGLPVYIVLTSSVFTWVYADPETLPPWWGQIAIFVGLGVLWAFPLKVIFKGVGQADPSDGG